MIGKPDNAKLDMDDLIIRNYVRPNKVERVFENDDWVVDILETDIGPALRVSVFKDCHFLDDTYVYKDDFTR